MLTRRQFLRGMGGSVIGAGAASAYAHWVEPQWLRLSRHTVPIGPGPQPRPLRVLHLSDLHLSNVVSLDFIAQAVELGLRETPDLIAVTGDFQTGYTPQPAAYSTVLARLAAVAPTYACLGNHDGGPWTRRAGGPGSPSIVLRLLNQAGITCLVNESRRVSLPGRDVQVIGLGDLWTGECEPAAAFARTPAREGALRIVLNHNPDAKELLRAHDWDLMLCGHTHGGQVRLPLIGTPFAPVKDKRYVEGLHRWENRWLHITRGVGNLHGVRFNCRPEVSVLTLT